MTSLGYPDWSDRNGQSSWALADQCSPSVDPPDQDLVDFDAVLTVLRRIPGVNAAYVLPAEDPDCTGTLRLQVADGADEAATAQKVRTVLREAFGLDVAGSVSTDAVDTRRSDDHPVPISGRHRRQGRLRIGGITVHSDVLMTRAYVELAHDDQVATGRIEVEGGHDLVNRAVAEATLSALIRLTNYRLHASIAGLELVAVGHEVSALVMVQFVGTGDAPFPSWGVDPLTAPAPTATIGTETLTGAVVVRGDERTAVVRAVLDAANRWIGPLLG